MIRLGLLLVLVGAARAAEPILLDDFDEPIAQRWSASGAVTAKPGAAPMGVGVDGVSGRTLRLEATGKALVQRKPIANPPGFADAERVVLRVHAPDATAERPVVFELRFVDDETRAWWWRKVEIDRPGWRKLDLPLRWFREGEGPLPRWGEVDRYGIYIRGASTLELDGVELIPGDHPGAADPAPSDIARVAFADRPGVRIVEREGFVLITDAAKLDPDAVLAALVEMRSAVERDLPGLAKGQRAALLVIFADEAGYRAFWPRFAAQFNSQIAAPRSDGFTSMGVATSFYSDRFGAVRPVYVHEACHSLLAERLRIGNRGEWLHEGLAVRYALPWMKQSLAPLVREALEATDRRLAFEKLLSGEKIPMNRYWQATSIVEWMFDDAERARRFREAIAQMTATGSTDLRPLAERYFGLTVPQMESAWLDWARKHYAAP